MRQSLTALIARLDRLLEDFVTAEVERAEARSAPSRGSIGGGR
jgi:hypothetical protein